MRLTLSTVLDLISTLSVMIGVIYGLIQLNHFQARRKRENALLVLNSYQSSDFTRGLIKIAEVPEDLTQQALWNLLGEDIEPVLMLADTFERIGWLVFQREIPIDLVEDAPTGQVLLSWKKLARAVEDMRAAEGRGGKALEWFQWLAERVEERWAEDPPVPAYIAHANWKA